MSVSYIWPDSCRYGTQIYKMQTKLGKRCPRKVDYCFSPTPEHQVWIIVGNITWVTNSASPTLSCISLFSATAVEPQASRALSWMIRLDTHLIFFWSCKHSGVSYLLFLDLTLFSKVRGRLRGESFRAHYHQRSSFIKNVENGLEMRNHGGGWWGGSL